MYLDCGETLRWGKFLCGKLAERPEPWVMLMWDVSAGAEGLTSTWTDIHLVCIVVSGVVEVVAHCRGQQDQQVHVVHFPPQVREPDQTVHLLRQKTVKQPASTEPPPPYLHLHPFSPSGWRRSSAWSCETGCCCIFCRPRTGTAAELQVECWRWRWNPNLCTWPAAEPWSLRPPTAWRDTKRPKRDAAQKGAWDLQFLQHRPSSSCRSEPKRRPRELLLYQINHKTAACLPPSLILLMSNYTAVL